MYIYILLLPSNGSAGQYKNFKNFANNLHQSDDFGLDCEWNFFATSHGKNTCDGIGGTVKWLVPRASLQSPLEGQILSVRQLFDWRMCNIQHITVAPRYNAVVGVHEMEPRCKRGALYIIFRQGRHHPQNATTATNVPKVN